MWDPDTELQFHAEVFAKAHGVHPFTLAYSWAEVIVCWHQMQPAGRYPGGTGTLATPENREHVVTTVAEALRLSMRTGRVLGDLYLSELASELGVWLYHGVDHPLPGQTGWPPPEGPHAQQWHA